MLPYDISVSAQLTIIFFSIASNIIGWFHIYHTLGNFLVFRFYSQIFFSFFYFITAIFVDGQG